LTKINAESSPEQKEEGNLGRENGKVSRLKIVENYVGSRYRCK
jgi:hypothetical protein